MTDTARVNEAIALAAHRKEFHVPYSYANILSDMDVLLVRDSHPLAFQPGTVHNRFAALVRDSHQFK